MSNPNNRFLIDSNSIIAPYKTFYPFDFAERFWIQLRNNIESGQIIVLDIVRDELCKGEDKLTDWINEFDEGLILSRNNMQILEKYGEIINYINVAPYYSKKALTTWSQESVADPWLIAAGCVYGYEIVTFENQSGNLNGTNPSKNPKIPDVAAHFGVQCCSLYNMMRVLSIGL
ncbi:MAG: DUF4411 family protein [Dethiosulfatibacter sp.]|nr:DUF4411 family protein [Dethiosulfatibacter sp.]